MLNQQFVIVDIDGTLATVGDRAAYLNKPNPNWDAFYACSFDDQPISTMITLVKHLSLNYTIVFCTGRREQVRKATTQWLLKHGLKPTTLLMRANSDTRDDKLVKPELVKNANINLQHIAFVLEDKSTVVQQWRKLGLHCLQVADNTN